MAAMEWLGKLLGDLDDDERRRLLSVLRAALNSDPEDSQCTVPLLAEEVSLWERLEARKLVVIDRFAAPKQGDFVDPRWYAAEAFLSDEGAHAVLALAAQAMVRLDLLVS